MSPHFLLATDLSAESCRAFETIGRLATRLGARITVLHAVSRAGVSGVGFPTSGGPSDAHIDEAVAEARARLLEVIQDCSAPMGDAEAVVEVGTDVVDTIHDYAEANGVDLVAMTTHGRTGLRRVLMGSVAEEVLRRSRIPVLMFPVGEVAD